MWADVVFVLLAGVPVCRGAAYSAYHYYESDNGDDDDTDFYDSYDGDVTTVPTLMTTAVDALTRVRRYEDNEAISTLGPEEIQDVKGALVEILNGRDLDRLTAPPKTTDLIQGEEAEESGEEGGGEEDEAARARMLMDSNTSPEVPTTSSTSTTTTTTTTTRTIRTIRTKRPMLRTDTSTTPNTTVSSSNSSSNSSNSSTTTEPTTITTTTIQTTVTELLTTTKSPRMDINAIIAIIANLTYDYDWNLTEQFNITLIKYGVPTCPTPTTPTTTTTTPSPYDFANTSVVAKCFVCGLHTPEIPRNAHCADAFAGDFLPLVPIDLRARAHIARYRKYCRFLDVHNFVENPSEPRSIYGRFTGGCGVRWTDLTGVYTQRTCRNRFKPLMGKHFASKRMAKLELALTHVENGCIISPMATLLPLSRGISLYARFHACVCTGSWCNKAVTIQKWNLYLTILWCWLTNIL